MVSKAYMKKKISFLCAALAGAVLLTSCSAPASKTSNRHLARAMPKTQAYGASAGSLPAPDALLPKPTPLAVVGSSTPSASFVSSSSLDLSISQQFGITRPTKAITTTYATYFITGTSQPNRPVYFDGQEIKRLGTLGTFGVHVPLTMGANTFTFSQDGESVSVTITRKSDAPAPIQEIQQDSMFPAVHGGAKAGGSLPVRCIAPSGAQVTASFGGKSVTMTQSVQAAKGVPAVFTGKLSVGSDYTSAVTEKIGPVSYSMSYGGATKQYKSSGSVYVAGEGGALAVRVTSYAGFVYPDTSKLYSFKSKLKRGASDYVAQQGSVYIELSSGGWIHPEQVEFLEGKVAISNTISDVSSQFGKSSESYTFSGTRSPAYFTRMSDGIFYFSMYNTKGAPSVDLSSSRIFSSSKATQKDGYVLYAFTPKTNIWGYNVSFDGGNTTIRFHYKPSLSSNPDKPFSGLRITLDPGHGGSDPGALGVAGKSGPDEAVLNLAHAYAIRDKLTLMGATVTLTRDAGPEKVSLDARILQQERDDADIFLSIHHNSVAESADANTISGMEIYYHTTASKKLADSMMSGLATGLNRNNRHVGQSFYRVTLMPYSPSLLLELGYLSNPLEYEKATSKNQINKVADAVANGLKQALS